MMGLNACLDRRLYGNKAFNLAILIREGFMVPPGKVIPSDYIKKTINKSSLEASEEELLKIVPEDPFKTELVVRSSSVQEDTLVHSAAGLYYSSKCNKDNYTREVVKVWKSPHSLSAVNFKKRYSLSLEEDIAVIIMPYILADKGGVLFTKHPSFKNMVLELSNFGSSGVTSGEDKGRPYGLPEDIGNNQLFKKLFEDSEKIEKIFDCPQDIEFLFLKKDIIYLQSRPIIFKKHIMT